MGGRGRGYDRRVRPARISVLVIGMLLVGALEPAGALASAEATTGNATSITDSSAQLNGAIDPVYPDSAWLFEYSTSPSFAKDVHYTPGQAAGQGVEAVAATVTGLSASTSYYDRVIVYQQADTTAGPKFEPGNTVSFTTVAAPVPPHGYGHASLTHSSITVSRNVASVVMKCTGGAGALCHAQLTLSARAGGKSISCGTGQFIAAAPHSHTVRVRPTGACLSALSAAPDHRLSATLKATFSTDQTELTRRVTLVG